MTIRKSLGLFLIIIHFLCGYFMGIKEKKKLVALTSTFRFVRNYNP